MFIRFGKNMDNENRLGRLSSDIGVMHRNLSTAHPKINSLWNSFRSNSWLRYLTTSQLEFLRVSAVFRTHAIYMPLTNVNNRRWWFSFKRPHFDLSWLPPIPSSCRHTVSQFSVASADAHRELIENAHPLEDPTIT